MKRVSGENIADFGGLRLALRALKANSNYNPQTMVDGFTPVQSFFLSRAMAWRHNVTRERTLQLLTLDPRVPNEMRWNGPLANMPDFHEAFDVKEGDPMFLPKEQPFDIW
mmetsp:Transcript_3426/g.6799  ORF Transcript_3426/g.6799 Transcript_3426/m.6799 type:complete len:110 (+) Transcript_3426:1930-2259(+)